MCVFVRMCVRAYMCTCVEGGDEPHVCLFLFLCGSVLALFSFICFTSATGDADDGSGNRTASTNPTTQADADVVADVARTLVLSVCDRQLIDVLLEQLASVVGFANRAAVFVGPLNL